MAKVVKAFSVDSDLARYIDEFPAGTRSEHVNWALRAYFFSSGGEEIEFQRDLASMWKDKALSEEGVKHHLVGFFKALFRVR